MVFQFVIQSGIKNLQCNLFCKGVKNSENAMLLKFLTFIYKTYSYSMIYFNKIRKILIFCYKIDFY